MSNDLYLRMMPNGMVQTIDPNEVPHYRTTPPVIEIAMAIEKAGYAGVSVDLIRQPNGQFLCVNDFDPLTIEGQIFRALAEAHLREDKLPTVEVALKQIKDAYARRRDLTNCDQNEGKRHDR